MKHAAVALVLIAMISSGCGSEYPYPKAPPGGPLVDGPFKDCVYSKGYGPAETLEQVEINGRALEACEGVPIEY